MLKNITVWNQPLFQARYVSSAGGGGGCGVSDIGAVMCAEVRGQEIMSTNYILILDSCIPGNIAGVYQATFAIAKGEHS